MNSDPLILIDIGNSGLRASISESLSSTVYKLSWSSIGQQISKLRPDQHITENRRWVELDDASGFDWLVQQCLSHCAMASHTHWRIASVNRNALLMLRKSIDRCAEGRANIEVIDYRDVGIEIIVDYPERVGIDRLLAAKAAIAWNRSQANQPNQSSKKHAPRAIIVVQAGTALTVDLVDEQERFQGGAILPGVGLSLQYLAAGTDQLPWIPTDSVTSPELPGKNTEQAIAAGVHASVVGGVRYLIERYRKEHGGKDPAPPPVVISGGDGKLLRGHVSPPVEFLENLVLVGLSLCPKHNRQKR